MECLCLALPAKVLGLTLIRLSWVECFFPKVLVQLGPSMDHLGTEGRVLEKQP